MALHLFDKNDKWRCDKRGDRFCEDTSLENSMVSCHSVALFIYNAKGKISVLRIKDLDTLVQASSTL